MQKLILAFAVCALASGIFLPSCRHELGQLPILPVDPSDTTVVPPPPDDPVDTSGVPCNPDTVYFENQILPLLVSNCGMSGCHDPISHEDGVITTDYTHIRQKVTPFNPNNSKLYKAIIDTDPDDRMPPLPAAPLTTEQKNLLKKWIEQGALNNACNEGYGQCDTSNVTYTNYVQALVANKCQGCHGANNPGAGIKLTNYAEVKASVESGKFYNSIIWTPGYSAMPQNSAKLSTCQLNKVKAWIDKGMPQ
ncbi:MAG: c-type cytochrome [Saprospiraceae bacterium]|nr:c-type cytochrome [Saprospiraceae bacterium]